MLSCIWTAFCKREWIAYHLLPERLFWNKACRIYFNVLLFLTWSGDRHTRDTGPRPGGEEHHRDAGHHSTCSLAGGHIVFYGRIRTVWIFTRPTGNFPPLPFFGRQFSAGHIVSGKILDQNLFFLYSIGIDRLDGIKKSLSLILYKI